MIHIKAEPVSFRMLCPWLWAYPAALPCPAPPPPAGCVRQRMRRRMLTPRCGCAGCSGRCRVLTTR